MSGNAAPRPTRRRRPFRPSVVRRAQFYRIWDGVFARGFETLTGGAFLVGFALALGASTFQIGLIAAIPFIAQLTNVLGIAIVERIRTRKRICLVCSGLSRSLWIPIALAPFLVPLDDALRGLMLALAAAATLNTIGNLAWSTWMKGLLPGSLRGRLFSTRLWMMGMAGMALSLAGAGVVDLATAGAGPAFTEGRTEALLPLAILFGVGVLCGLAGLTFLVRIPEIPSAPTHHVRLAAALGQPFRDARFRRLVAFTGSWAFAIHMVLPFIPVYLLQTLGYSFITVMGMAVASQAATLSLVQIWGRLSDRFGNKAVLAVSAPVFVLAIALWPFTVGITPWLTIGMIALIHVMMGMAIAGTDVANTNILFQLAPQENAAAYFSAATLVNATAAGLAPLVGGAVGNLLSEQAVTLSLGSLTAPHETTLVRIAHLDFVFLAAFLMGGFALKRLIFVTDRPREAPRTQVIQSLKTEIENISTVRGLKYLTQSASVFAGLVMETSPNVGPHTRTRARDPHEPPS